LKANKTFRFSKMHGLGNDFMIIDARKNEPNVNKNLVRALSNRNLGVGFDQLAVVYDSSSKITDCYVKFWNSDGSISPTCGNATRCIAKVIIEEKNIRSAVIETETGILKCNQHENGVISVNMGNPKMSWKEIPLAIECDTLYLPLKGNPVATSMGNPHCTFFVDDVESHDLNEFGRAFENHQIFPQRTNVQIAQILSNELIKVKVWERGVGKTLASGSSSCAVAVAAARRGLTGKKTRILLDGGELEILWSDDGVWMSGEVAKVFDGIISNDFFSQMRDLQNE